MLQHASKTNIKQRGNELVFMIIDIQQKSMIPQQCIGKYRYIHYITLVNYFYSTKLGYGYNRSLKVPM